MSASSLRVAQAQALALEHVVVEVRDDAQEQVAGRGADQAVQPRRVVGGETGKEEDRDRRQRDHVGQAACVAKSMNDSTISTPANAK